jgi:hypothetical protein
MMNLFVSALDPNSIDQEKLFEIKKHFERTSDMIETDEEYKMFFYGFNNLMSLSQLFQIFNIILSHDLFLKLEKYLDGKKYSYLKTFASQETVPECISFSIDKSSRYLKELGGIELHPWSLSLKFQEIIAL